MLQMLRAKLHGIHVTACDLNYHGSITLDAEICARAGIYPLEFVYIWNKNNGKRLSTYVLMGERGSRCCVLNGAAARLCQRGDPLIVSAFAFVADPREYMSRAPRVLTFGPENEIKETLQYKVSPAHGWYEMKTEPCELP